MNSVTDETQGGSTLLELEIAGTTDVQQYMSFWINGRTYAIPLTQVAEITPMCELNQMPHMPKYVEGLLDLRGQVLPVVSLRTRMGLPKNESNEVASILILSHEGSRIGVLVDQVESVITATSDQHAKMSPLLEGVNGIWVIDILLLKERVILVLDSGALASIAVGEVKAKEEVIVHLEDIELHLDESLNKLIEESKERENINIYPLMQQVVHQTESEMTKVLDNIESMLISTDNQFAGISRFKQEIAMSKDQRFTDDVNKLGEIAQQMQNDIFDVINQLQFQDIIRQKLERIMRHLSIMGEAIASGFH